MRCEKKTTCMALACLQEDKDMVVGEAMKESVHIRVRIRIRIKTQAKIKSMHNWNNAFEQKDWKMMHITGRILATKGG
jgi:hypothetical protein